MSLLNQNNSQKDLSLYIHWPFCLSKCPYCDFNSLVVSEIDEDAYEIAYLDAIEYYYAQLGKRTIKTIYFGGGTPSLMPPALVEKIIEKASRKFGFSDNCEITLEANPTSADREKFKAFKAAGVNRLSLGVQSFKEEDLKFLGRTHDVPQAISAIEDAAKIFKRFSFDLIYARPNQTAEDWQKEMALALSFEPKHLSLYQLTLEEGSVFYKRKDSKSLVLDEEKAADLYLQTNEYLQQKGLCRYEISNYASCGEESRHNLAYWHYDDYVGIGAGAHGRYRKEGKRFATEDYKNPKVWLENCGKNQNGCLVKTELSEYESMQEALLMGLRLTKGILLEDWREKFPTPLNAFLDFSKVESAKRQGLVSENDTHFFATADGLLRLNALIEYLI